MVSTSYNTVNQEGQACLLSYEKDKFTICLPAFKYFTCLSSEGKMQKCTGAHKERNVPAEFQQK
jgi:hypothetical protein